MAAYELPMKDGKVDMVVLVWSICDSSVYHRGKESIEALVSHARAEERERCAKEVRVFQDVIGWQEGEVRNELIKEIEDAIRNMEDET